MVGGLGAAGKGGRKGGYPSGPGHGVQHGGLPRPASVGDFNEADEENWNINQMPDYEVQAEFEKMLENMNLSGECLTELVTNKLVLDVFIPETSPTLHAKMLWASRSIYTSTPMQLSGSDRFSAALEKLLNNC